MLSILLAANPRRACAGGLRKYVVCVSVCPAPRVLPLRATEGPTEGTYGFGAIWLNMAFSLFKSYGMKKPTS